jgi:phage shock protein C
MDFSKRLYRSKSEKMIAGVCGGLASYFSVDPTLVRLVFILLLFAPPSGLLLYLILALVTPLEP